jgi:Rhs element Vgr protein
MPENRLVPTPAASDLPTYTILVEGEEINSSYRLLSVMVTKELSRISQAEISLLDGDVSTEDFQVSNTDDLIPGKNIEIQAGYHGNNSTIFKGVIVKHAIRILQSEASTLNITVKHPAFISTLNRKNKVFKDKKDSEAIEEILGDAGLDKEVEATNVQHESLVQYNATDWDFINLRAEANGKIVIPANDKILIKAPVLSSEPVLSLYYGSSIIEFEAEMDARKAFTNYISSTWNASDQEVNTAEEPETAVASPQGNLAVSDLASAIGIDDFNIFITAPVVEQEADELAKAKILRHNLAKIRGRVKCNGIAAIEPGDLVNLNGVGDRFNGHAFVSGVSHSIAEGNWVTDIQIGLSPVYYANQFDDINEKPASGVLPAVNGLQVAKVIKLENDPEGENRVEVKLPQLSESDSTCWARVATLDAGNERGSFFLPDLDDEVIVGFIDDDPRKAVVLGMLNSSRMPAPVTAADANHIKGFYTRSKMKVEFDDEKKIITIETPAGNKMIFSEEDTSILINDQNANKILMNTDGISMESAKDIAIKATGDVKIEGINISLKANASLKAEGSASAEVSASGTTTIKGGMVQIN